MVPTMKLIDRIERSRAPIGPREWTVPARPAKGKPAVGFDRCEKALVDVVWTLQHKCPPATRQGLALMLGEFARQDLEILGRDALVRFAAWAINGAVRLDEIVAERRAHDVC